MNCWNSQFPNRIAGEAPVKTSLLPLRLSVINAICVSNRPVIHRPVTQKTGVNFNRRCLIYQPCGSDVRFICRRWKLQLTGR